MTEAEQRVRVVAEARRWLGTPYHPEGDIIGPKGGVDCGLLLVRVFVDTGLCAPFDPRPYPKDWHLHRSEEKYLGFVFDRCCEIETPQLGDVAVFKFGRCYAHGAIVSASDPLTLIHAYSSYRRVAEEPLNVNTRLCDPARAVRYFSYWAKAR